MHASELSIAMGVAVLLFATGYMVAHYRREHRRARLTRQLAYSIRYGRGRRH